MEEEGLRVNSVEEIYLILKSLQAKWKQGIGINRTQEFMTLVKLCFTSDRSLNFAASRSVLYLLKWKFIDSQTMLGALVSSAERTEEVSGIINFLAQVILDSEKSDSINYLRYISQFLITNKTALFSVLSLFDELDIDIMLEKFRPVINDLLFEMNNIRMYPWIKITDKVNIHLHHTFLHCLKFSNPEDCSLALISIQKLKLGIIEKCFILSSVIHHQMLLGVSSAQAIDILKDLIPSVDIQTHSIVILSIINGVAQYSMLYIMMIFDLCDWFLDNVKLWNGILMFMFASLLPFTKKDVFAPMLHLKIEVLMDKINQKLTFSKMMNMIPVKSLILRYTVYRHNCIYESILLLRLIISFSNNKEQMNSWLQSLLDHVPNRSIENVVTMYFLYGDVTTRSKSLSVLSKWHFGDVHLYFYQLKKEKCPLLQYKILKTLGMRCESKCHTAFFKKVLTSVENVKHENSLNLCGELYYHAWMATGQNIDNLLDFLKPEGVSDLVKAAAMKHIALKLDIYCDDLIPLMNKIINKSKDKNGTYATALAIDTISIMCEKGFLDVSLLWDSFVQLVANDKHPTVQKSVCNFLSIIPVLIDRSDDPNNVLYRSARLLWHFVTSPSYDRNSALRSLKEYDLEDFDISFLSEQCQQNLKAKISTSIPAMCWLDLIMENNAVDLFVHLINKISKCSKFRGNYSNLFHGIINALKSFMSDEKNNFKTVISLKLLGANWTNIPPTGIDIAFFENLLESADPEVKCLALYALLKLYPMNIMAKNIFESFLQKSQYDSKEKSIMCLLPVHLLSNQRTVNDEILFDGVSYGLCSDDTDYNSGELLKNKILGIYQSCATDEGCPEMCRRLIMIVMLRVWIKIPYSHQAFISVTKFLAKTYGKPLMKALPLDSPDEELCLKYAYFSTEIALETKSLYGFDLAVKMGLSHMRIRGEIIKCLLNVLNGIGHVNIERNIKWFIRLLCTVCMHPDNFLCQVLVHCANYLSGTNLYSVNEPLTTSLNLFPLAIVKISDMRKMPKEVMMALYEIVKMRKVDPCFIEVFKLGILALRDDPDITIDAVTKNVMEM